MRQATQPPILQLHPVKEPQLHPAGAALCPEQVAVFVWESEKTKPSPQLEGPWRVAQKERET